MSEFDRLRSLLLAEEREALARAQQRLDTLDEARDGLAESLPGLVRRAPPQPMADALATPVASALGSAVRSQSKSIVDALFPIIGPLIRKSIAEALRGLMGDINGALEQSLTVRGLRWRVEAWRSGAPYAQVVLKHTLRYRIDHLFVIERDSGLVLRRESAPGLPDLDADAIAGMLTAIGQFVRDSVGRDRGDSLEEARVGEYLLWLVDGPRVSIASFIQGVPPDRLRETLELRLEAIHVGLDGVESPQPVDLAGIELDPAELARVSLPEGTPAPSPSRWPALILLAVVLAALGWYGLREWRWQARVGELRSALASHPGFVLDSLDSRTNKAIAIRGLLDADAEPIAPLLARAGIAGIEPGIAVSGYVSTDDAIVARRARRLLAAPDSVTVEAKAGELRLGGHAPAAWIARARERAGWVPGVQNVVLETLDDVDPAASALARLQAVSDRLAGLSVRFVRDDEPAPESEATVRSLAEGLHEASGLAATAGVHLVVDVIGSSDPSGTDEINASLRGARARWLADALVARGIDAGVLRLDDARAASSAATMVVRGASVRPTIEPAAR
ncbi:MAG: hypothetical protein J0L88_15195 [Xanthomonadales bacterium]|nr:hypothetical protein [Xanthomonadales bacterium]